MRCFGLRSGQLGGSMETWQKLFATCLFLCGIVDALDFSKCRFNLTLNGRQMYYDLSSLSRQRLWQIRMPSIGNGTEYIFISVCGQFENTDASKCPDTNASVCIAKQTHEGNWIPLIKNGGREIEVKNDTNGDLVLHYINGEKCSVNEVFSTEITFYCMKDHEEENPFFSAYDNNCKLFLTWKTPIACPISHYIESKHSCILKLSDSGLMFDLNPLRHPNYYTVQSNSTRTFQINICGPVVNGFCETSATICEVNSFKNVSLLQTLGYFDKSSIHYSVDKGLFFTSRISKHSFSEIHFVCNESVHTGDLKLISVNHSIYTFEMETYLACIYSPVECVAYDSGKKFDLNTLRKRTDNYKVFDTRNDHSDVRYYFNVCSPLNPIEGTSFSGETIASCSIGPGEVERNLGFLNFGPIAQKNGPLILRYTGGSLCADGFSRYSTLIIFQCSKQDHDPVFVTESESCVVTFMWETPAACPIQSAVGQYCKVRDPEYSNLFDLKTLHNAEQDYYINSSWNSSFRINVCGPLIKKCAGYANVSVCLIRDGVEVPVGFKYDKPEYTDGRIMLKFTGARCQPTVTESVVYLTFLCDHEPPIPPLSPKFVTSDDLCNFFFLWHVKEVCPPFQNRSCKITDSNGLEYDLTQLSLTSDNHMTIFKDEYNNTLKFLINVCRSVVFGYGATCGFEAGICMENQTLPNSHNNLINLGEVNDEMLKFDDGVLSLHYRVGDVCMDNASPHFSSVIYFYCDWNATETMPKFLRAKPCAVEFVWNSSVACPLRNSKSNTGLVPKTGNCTTVNPATGFIFDFSSIWKSTFTVYITSYKFIIAVCGNVTSRDCDEGVCKQPASSAESRRNNAEMPISQNYGYGNADLQYRMGSLFLNYTGGMLCKDNVSRNTIIEFVCGVESASQGPKFIEEVDGCTALFIWTTDLACEKRIKCNVEENDEFISLSPLISSIDNYRTTGDGHVFFINICRPLVPVRNLSCGGSSAVCMADEVNDGDYINELNLGSPYYHSVFDPVFEERDVILKYFSGSPCPHHSENSASRGLNYSASFRFICNKTAGKGSPVFMWHTDDCQYAFEWKTSVVCTPGSFDSDRVTDKCVIHNDEYDTIIDLRPMFNDDHVYKVEVMNGSSFFILNLCGSFTVCHGKRVCKMPTSTFSISYGDVCNVEFYNSNESVMKLTYNHGTPCQRMPNLSFSSVVWFKCDPAAGNGTPKLLSESESKCFAEFEWRSSIVCEMNKRKEKETSSHTTVGLVIGLLVLFTLLCVLFVYFRKPTNRSNFRNRVDILLGRRRQDGLCHYMRESDDGWNEL